MPQPDIRPLLRAIARLREKSTVAAEEDAKWSLTGVNTRAMDRAHKRKQDAETELYEAYQTYLDAMEQTHDLRLSAVPDRSAGADTAPSTARRPA